VTDRIVLANMRFEAAHGVQSYEKTSPQRFEVDVELELDVAQAGRLDELERTVDYGSVAKLVAAVLHGPAVDLLETLAARIAADVLAGFAGVDAVTVRVRKPDVRLVVPLDHAGVEIRRVRP
jgi:dihydroneopterin aldolase/2-amino-4-hydroxy-6-hydroxymethyldihydropteridine diphosphokinase